MDTFGECLHPGCKKFSSWGGLESSVKVDLLGISCTNRSKLCRNSPLSSIPTPQFCCKIASGCKKLSIACWQQHKILSPVGSRHHALHCSHNCHHLLVELCWAATAPHSAPWSWSSSLFPCWMEPKPAEHTEFWACCNAVHGQMHLQDLKANEEGSHSCDRLDSDMMAYTRVTIGFPCRWPMCRMWTHGSL